MERRIELARRMERLIIRGDGQRAALAESFSGLEKPLALLDRGVDAANYLRANPVLLGAGVAVALVIGRRGVFRWAGRGFMAWRAWRSAAGLLRRVLA